MTWDGLDVDLSKMHERSELVAAMITRYPDGKPKAIMRLPVLTPTSIGCQ